MTKNNLIEMLKKSLTHEDEFVISYGNDLLDRIDNTVDLDSEVKEKVKNLLRSLLIDTKRHSQTISDLIKKVEGDERNEF